MTTTRTAACLSAAAQLESRAATLWRTWHRNQSEIRELIGQVSALHAEAERCPADNALTEAVTRLRWWAVTFLNQLGDSAEEAIAAARSLASDTERLLGADHPDAIVARDNLGATYRTAGRAAEAISVHEHTAAASRRVLGPDHPETLNASNNLALAYRAAGRTTEAIEAHERTLADRERTLGIDHPDTLASRNNLALAYRAAGRTTEAIALHERTLAARESVLGTDHPSTLTSRNNLALAYRAAGRTTEAIALHERTAADRERVLGTDHPDTRSARDNLALAYRDGGRIAEAAIVRQQVAVGRSRRGVISPRDADRRQVRLEHLIVILAAKGRTSAQIASHLTRIYETEVSELAVATTIGGVMDRMADWQNRPLSPAYPVMFIDAVMAKVGDGRVVTRRVYLGVGVTSHGDRDVLGLWPGTHRSGGDDAAFWVPTMTGLRDRGAQDVRVVVAGDGLSGLPAGVSATWNHASVQPGISTLCGGSVDGASRRERRRIADDLAWVCVAASEPEAANRLARFASTWEERHPAVVASCENAWPQIARFVELDQPIRTAICSTHTIELVRARLWRTINARGPFPTEQTAFQCLYLTIMSMEASWRGRQRWAARWTSVGDGAGGTV